MSWDLIITWSHRKHWLFSSHMGNWAHSFFLEGRGGGGVGGGPSFSWGHLVFFFIFMLAPRHGYWGSWQPSSWGSTSCSGGVRTRKRYCNDPSPANGGNPCRGSSTEKIDCNECEYNNGGCAQRCINHDSRGYNCRCYRGYKPAWWNSDRCVRKCMIYFYCCSVW